MKKIFNIYLAVILAAQVCVAQQIELVDFLPSVPAGSNKSYIYTKGVTLTPGFTKNASLHGPFFIRPAEAAKIPQNIPPNVDQNFVRIENIFVEGVTNEDQITALNAAQRSVEFEYSDP